MLLIFKSILIVLFLVSNVQGQKANEEVNQYHPTISPDDIEMTIETDKRSYFPNEPIVLAITLRNKTGRQLDFMHDANRLHTCEITVLDPYREEKHIEFGKDKANGFTIPEHEPTPVPKTKYGDPSVHARGSLRPNWIPPHGRDIFSVSLSRMFDLSYPSGIYTVKVRYDNHYGIKPNHVFEQTTTFKIRDASSLSSMALMGENLSWIIGKTRAIDLLSSEAEAIMDRLETLEDSGRRDDPDYSRLMAILESLGYLFHTDELRYMALHNAWTLDDFRKFIGKYNNKE